ncbi:MAG: HAD family phosphatase [Chloroflexota bacterium]|nr:HAD family phosphatase [Chloroflexota bacterium]
MAVAAVIFDMDGLLIDSEVYWWQARCEFAAARGKTWTMDDQRAAMGRSTIEWAHVMQERLELDMTLQAIMDDMISRINHKLEERLPLLPGAVEAVQLAASAYPVALASGSPTGIIRRVMELTKLDSVLRVQVYGDDMARGKPHPDIYLEAAKQLGVAPETCVALEDSGNGVRSAHAAGMYCIAIPTAEFPLSDEVLALATVKLNSLHEFTLDLLKTF